MRHFLSFMESSWFFQALRTLRLAPRAPCVCAAASRASSAAQTQRPPLALVIIASIAACASQLLRHWRRAPATAPPARTGTRTRRALGAVRGHVALHERQGGLAAGHGEVDVREDARVEQRAVQLAARVVDAVALAQRIETVALARDAARARAPACRAPGRSPRAGAAPPGRRAELGVEEGDVEGGVVDHELRAARRTAAAPRRSPRSAAARRARCARCRARRARRRRCRARDSGSDGRCARSARRFTSSTQPISMMRWPQLGFEAGGFGVEDDLAHGEASLPHASARLRRRSPHWPADRRARCRGRRRDPGPSATRARWLARSCVELLPQILILDRLASAVRQPRAFQARSHSVMPRRTYCESV